MKEKLSRSNKKKVSSILRCRRGSHLWIPCGSYETDEIDAAGRHEFHWCTVCGCLKELYEPVDEDFEYYDLDKATTIIKIPDRGL